ncbi:MAG: hypothetical protein ACO1O1_03205 [Adhaeribacter sp.]
MPLHQAICDFELENDEIGVRVYSEISMVYVFWKKHSSGGVFQQAFREGLKQVYQRKLQYWLSDSRALNYAYLSDQQWVAGEVSSLLAGSTLRKVAHVVPDDDIRTMVALQLADKLRAQLPDASRQVEVFTNLEHALYWLGQEEDPG